MNKKQIRAILIDIVPLDITKEQAQTRLEELESLVKTYGGIVVIKTIQKRGVPAYETYIGKGKVKELGEVARTEKADILVVNNLLKPRQIYNLNEIFRKDELKLKAWDRMDLILKIFDKHAKSAKAKLQIELASIRHMGPRIFGMGIELSRQAGAKGVRAGSGEANIEMMKRHLRTHELSILKKLAQHDKIHEGHRKRRKRQNFRTVALVGYTNAGKSSLMNALTGKGAYVADKLFATLDTRIAKIFIPPPKGGTEYQPGKEVLLSDTIGFIQDLPSSLIAAFKSTLSETVEADLLLHVIDIADPEMEEKIKCVEDILKQLGLEKKDKIYVFNKVDLIAPENIFKKIPKRGASLVKAGEHAADHLGWTGKARKTALEKMSSTKKRHKHHKPIFISAESKMNLEELVGVLG